MPQWRSPTTQSLNGNAGVKWPKSPILSFVKVKNRQGDNGSCAHKWENGEAPSPNHSMPHTSHKTYTHISRTLWPHAFISSHKICDFTFKSLQMCIFPSYLVVVLWFCWRLWEGVICLHWFHASPPIRGDSFCPLLTPTKSPTQYFQFLFLSKCTA